MIHTSHLLSARSSWLALLITAGALNAQVPDAAPKTITPSDRLNSVVPNAPPKVFGAKSQVSGSRLESVIPMLAQNARPIPPQTPGGIQQRLGSPTAQQAPRSFPNPNVTPPSSPLLPKTPGAASAAVNPTPAAAKPTEPGKEGEVDLQFPNTPLPEILLLYEQLTGKKIIRDIQVEGVSMTIETTGKMPKAEAIEFIEKSLLLNGYGFVPSGERMLKMLAVDSKKPTGEGGVPLFAKLEDLPKTDQVVNYFTTLTYIEPEDASKVLSDLIPPHSYGKIAAVPNSRAIVITENSATIRSIVEMLKHLDAEPSRTTQKSFQLTRENAEDVKTALDEILDTEKKNAGGGSSSGGGYTGQRPNNPQTPAAPIPGQPTPATNANAGRSAIVSGSGSSTGNSATVPPKIIAIPRRNSLLVIARPVDMTYIGTLIEELDAAAEIQNFVTRQLKYLAATEALTILEQAITRGNEGAGGGSGGGSSPATSSGTNTNQTTSSLGRSSQNSGLGGGGLGGGNSFGSGGLGGGGFGSSGRSGGGIGGYSGGGSGGLQSMREDQGPQALIVGKTLLIADSRQNEIFASGPPEHLRVMNEILDELDQRPKQIMISAVIGEVTLADGVEFGIDWLLRPTELKYNGDKSAIGAGAIRNTGSTILDPSGIETLADLADIGNGLTFYGTINDNVNLIVNALKSNTAFKVISRPSVFTLNNQSATISSGSSIPIPTQTTSSFTGGVDSNQGLTSNIAYQDINLSLEVVPLINSDDELTLKIFQENNEQSGTTEINGNPYPTISNQTVNTTVMVKNNSAVLLGGLIRENNQKEKNGIPLLSRIPIVKYLFGSVKNAVSRRELIVFIQPRIVSGDGDLPPNVDDNAGQSAFSNETRAILKQEQSSPTPPAKNSRIMRLLDKLIY